MKFCQPHWEALRAAIDKRGLSSLVSDSGEGAARALAREVTDGQSVDTFDPLMNAHWAIVGNLMGTFGAIQVMSTDGCPMCKANEAHERDCVSPDCPIPKVNGYDHWIDRAADDQVAAWQEMGGQS